MNRALLAAALALPLAGLTASIAARELALSGASEWRIPITGYDPRDPIRGRYIAFAYDWQVRGETSACTDASCALCLERVGDATVVSVEAPGDDCPGRIDVQASDIDVRTPAAASAPLQFASRIFVSETSAPRLEVMLREQPMVVLARLTRGGRLVHDRLDPADQSNGD